ncbi:glyoxalase [Amorphoplanes auranticolor]|uniref:Glyoxalase n=2 Tax=Actinoplanes auranticolor TaxID=47988 RepID=A0A919VSR5_9ACTN|nr:glyoxalase [Actinoplanes auranticolor]
MSPDYYTRLERGDDEGMTTHWTLTSDAADPQRLARFWAAALGYVDEPGYDFADGASLIDPEGRLPAISFLRVPEGKTAKNRLHLDIRVAAGQAMDPAVREQRIRAKVAELVAAGATAVREESYGVLDHVVMQDPEGNEFCVA